MVSLKKSLFFWVLIWFSFDLGACLKRMIILPRAYSVRSYYGTRDYSVTWYKKLFKPEVAMLKQPSKIDVLQPALSVSVDECCPIDSLQKALKMADDHSKQPLKELIKQYEKSVPYKKVDE